MLMDVSRTACIRLRQKLAADRPIPLRLGSCCCPQRKQAWFIVCHELSHGFLQAMSNRLTS